MKHLWMPRLVERIASSQNVDFTPNHHYSPENSTVATATSSTSSESMGSSFYGVDQVEYGTLDQMTNNGGGTWFNGGDAFENLWSVDDLNNWLLQ